MPKGIVVVGLGPGDPGLLTVEAWRVLQNAHEVYVRTRQHPTVGALPSSLVIHSFDDLYDRADTFEGVYAEIASRVVELGCRAEGIVYAVPGHPLVGESSVQRILTLAEERGLPVRIVEGLCFVETTCVRLKIDPLNGFQVADAMMLARRHYPEFNPDLPLLVGQIYSRDVAADVKLVLLAVYPDDHPVTLLTAVGTEGEAIRTIPLYELDRSESLDHLTSLYVPAVAEPGSLAAFQEIVARLRAPGGCPWDQEQTHDSLRPFLLEETYEVLEALDDSDLGSLREELGDLLLQILLHTQIAIEHGEFNMADVVSGAVAKLKRRHPHVFGDIQVANVQEVLGNWERIKAGEADHKPSGGMLAGVPKFMPALARTQALQRRASRVGFDWAEFDGVRQEWRDLRDASAAGDDQGTALGGLLFSLVNVARELGIDAEAALRKTGARFQRGFHEMERQSAALGQELGDLGFSELAKLWEKAQKGTG